MPTVDELQARRGDVAAEIKRLTKFDEMTASQRAKMTELSAEFNDIEADLNEYKRADLAAKVKAGQVGYESGDGARNDLSGSMPGARQGEAAHPLPEWATKSRRSNTWAASTADHLQKAMTATGRKAIVSGGYEVQSPILGDIVQLPTYPQRVLDLLVSRTALNTGNVFTWLQQSVRSNNAQSVPDTKIKPTSIYTFIEQEDRVRTVAHLSEEIPNRYLSDFRGLQEFLQSEMSNGLMLEVERQILTGNGTPGASAQSTTPAEDMQGLLNTPGILVQPWNTNLLTTLRKAATALELEGQAPNAWALHPSDVEALDLLMDNEARHYFDGPSQQFAEGVGPVPNTPASALWSTPVVKSVAVPQGTAILGDWSMITLVVREDAQLAIDASGDLRFERNLFMARLEGRFGVYVQRPSAFCSVDLTA